MAQSQKGVSGQTLLRKQSKKSIMISNWERFKDK